MSVIHRTAFTTIRDEYGAVVAALTQAAKEKGRRVPGGDSHEAASLIAAISTADDAYALLLIAKAEGFLRQYLASIGKLPAGRPGLDGLINKAFKEFNATNPSMPLQPEDKAALHDLRENRNAYAHGIGTSVFPTVARVAAMLSKFFDQIP